MQLHPLRSGENSNQQQGEGSYFSTQLACLNTCVKAIIKNNFLIQIIA